MLLYKYRQLSEWTLKILSSGELWFAAPETLNDPFDCDLDLSADNADLLTDIATSMRDHLRDLDYRAYRTLARVEERGVGETRAEAWKQESPWWSPEQRGWQSQKEAVKEFFASHEAGCVPSPGCLETFARQLEKLAGKHYGVLSMSMSSLPVLMWSHYSEQHAGVCLGFDAGDRLFMRQPGIGAFPVVYSNERVVIPETKEDPIAQLYVRKALDWEYEKEVRFISYLGSGSRRYKPGRLRQVILGCRFWQSLSSPDRVANARELIRQVFEINRAMPKGGKIHVYEAVKVPGEFRIRATLIDDIRVLWSKFYRATS